MNRKKDAEIKTDNPASPNVFSLEFRIRTFFLLMIFSTASNLFAQETAEDHLRKGRRYNDQGNYDQAISELDQAIGLDPKSALAYYARGYYYQNKGNYDQTISDYSKAIELDPNYADAYYSRGRHYLDKGNYDQAILDYNQAVELYNKAANLKSVAYAHNNRGNAYSAKGNDDQAILDYNKSIELDGSYGGVYYARGNSYLRKGNYDQAILDYNKSLELAPTAASAYHSRGLAYYLKQEYGKALADLQQAELLGFKVNPTTLIDVKIGLGTVGGPAWMASELVKTSLSGEINGVQLLLANKTDPNSADQDYFTALHWAAYNGHLEVVKALVEHGANMNIAMNRAQMTPLMSAAANGQNAIVKYLIEQGVDQYLESKDGWIAEDFARAFDKEK